MTVQPLTPFVLKPGRIGDMIMLTAATRLLRHRYGSPCCVVGAESWLGDVYLGSDDVARCWSLPRKAPFVFSLAWLPIVRALRASAPGPVYVFEHHPKQLPRLMRLLALSRIDSGRCVLIDEEPGNSGLWLDRLLRFAEQTPPALRQEDYPSPTGAAPAPRLWVLEDERRQCEARLRERGWLGRPLVLVQPGNHRSMGRRRRRQWRSLDDKTWPLHRWVGLLHAVHARMPDAILVLRGARAEAPMLESIRTAAALDAVGIVATSLRPFFALCEVAHSMISIDSGPAHAAAALGLPLVVLYGIQSPDVWLPRSANGSPVVPVGGPPHFERAEQISVDAVFEAWRSLADAKAQAAAQAAFEPPPAPLSTQMRSVRIEPSALSSSVR
jgi:ADP-heptose:LPS heptosyltransferase